MRRSPQAVGLIYDWFTEGFDTADLQEAKALLVGALQRFREIYYSSPAGDFSCAFSAGVAEAQGGELSDVQLVGLADQALYSAKRGGRSRVHRARPRRDSQKPASA